MTCLVSAHASYSTLRPCLRISSRILSRCMSSSSQATPSTPRTSPFAPRHFLSIGDLTTAELTKLVQNAAVYKAAFKSGKPPAHLSGSLSGKTIAVMFNKRSTRTRVSTESAVVSMGGHPMFLGPADIHFGVNESLHDTSIIISSMTDAMIARVKEHAEVAGLAKHSSVPVINALSDAFHPLQTIADVLTIHEAFPAKASSSNLGLDGLKIAWVGDANNVLFDLATGAGKLGIQVAVATPKGYEIPTEMRQIITDAAGRTEFLSESNVPEEAVKDADILVTDTWVSMGREEETAKRLRDFAGFQITSDLAHRGGAKQGWRFMHCLPRHPEEVSDEIFHGPKSLVFQEGENRLWAAVAVLEAFVVNNGKIV